MIRVQSQDFDLGAEYAAFAAGNHQIGGICLFVGLVRDFSAGNQTIQGMTLEHYPGMTEKQLAAIEDEARRRWSLADVLIIHRYGTLLPGDQIVLVATAAAHRDAAFAACQFLMDWLKTKAPFWKLEQGEHGADWVAAKDSDTAAAERW